MTTYIGFVGTYTKKESKGIYSFTLDSQNGRISNIQVAAELENPTYLAISEDNRHLYSVVKEDDSGGVASFSLEPSTGKLLFLNSQVTKGAPPCHVSVNKRKKLVLSANYHKGLISAYPLSADGSISPPSSEIEHVGNGPDPRQEKPHTHYTAFTPDEKYIIAVELGSDTIYTYEVKNQALHEVNRLKVKPGSGPRHLVFHPTRRYAFVMTEFSSEVITLRYNATNGSFTETHAVSTIPSGFKDNNQGSAIHITKDGRFLYAGNRGHNSIASFEINQETGELTFLEHTSSGGDWPRDFVLDPSEKYLIVSNQESGNLVLFSRGTDGRLTTIQADIKVPEPVCVKFLHDVD